MYKLFDTMRSCKSHEGSLFGQSMHLSDSLDVYQSGCLSDCLSGWLAVYLAGWLAVWLAGWLSPSFLKPVKARLSLQYLSVFVPALVKLPICFHLSVRLSTSKSLQTFVCLVKPFVPVHASQAL